MKITSRLRASAREDSPRSFSSELLLEAAREIETLGDLYHNASIRADERRVMCDEKDETIKQLTSRLWTFRQYVWEYLVYTDGDGHTASGWDQDDIPDDLLIDAIVDSTRTTT